MNFRQYYINQAGGQYSVYRGIPRQKGYGLGGIFKSLYRYVLPFLKDHALPVIKKGAEFVGNEAIRAAGNIATDAIKGNNIKDSFKQNATNIVDNISAEAKSKLQSGSGRGRKRKLNKINIKNKTHKKNYSFSNNKTRRLSDIFDKNF
jgi:hypothetical protein